MPAVYCCWTESIVGLQQLLVCCRGHTGRRRRSGKRRRSDSPASATPARTAAVHKQAPNGRHTNELIQSAQAQLQPSIQDSGLGTAAWGPWQLGRERRQQGRGRQGGGPGRGREGRERIAASSQSSAARAVLVRTMTTARQGPSQTRQLPGKPSAPAPTGRRCRWAMIPPPIPAPSRQKNPTTAIPAPTDTGVARLHRPGAVRT